MVSTNLTNTNINSGTCSIGHSITGTSASSISWSNPTYTDLVVTASLDTDSAALHVRGKIKMHNGDILDERLERIESLLEIPTRDLEMEREFPKLRKLWNAYTEELEKYKMWKKLKDNK